MLPAAFSLAVLLCCVSAKIQVPAEIEYGSRLDPPVGPGAVVTDAKVFWDVTISDSGMLDFGLLGMLHSIKFYSWVTDFEDLDALYNGTLTLQLTNITTLDVQLDRRALSLDYNSRTLTIQDPREPVLWRFDLEGKLQMVHSPPTIFALDPPTLYSGHTALVPFVMRWMDLPAPFTFRFLKSDFVMLAADIPIRTPSTCVPLPPTHAPVTPVVVEEQEESEGPGPLLFGLFGALTGAGFALLIVAVTCIVSTVRRRRRATSTTSGSQSQPAEASSTKAVPSSEPAPTSAMPESENK